MKSSLFVWESNFSGVAGRKFFLEKPYYIYASSQILVKGGEYLSISLETYRGEGVAVYCWEGVA